MSQQPREQIKTRENQITAWLRRNYRSQSPSSTEKRLVYDGHVSYCNHIGIPPMDKSMFGKLVFKTFSELKSKRKYIDNKSHYEYEGLQLYRPSYLVPFNDNDFKIKDANPGETWRELYQWAEKFRQENNLTTPVFLSTICGIEPTRTRIMLLSNLGKLLNFAKSSPSYAVEIFCALREARAYYSLHSYPKLLDLSSTIFTDEEKLNYCLWEFSQELHSSGLASITITTKSNGNTICEASILSSSKLSDEEIRDFFTSHADTFPSEITISKVELLGGPMVLMRYEKNITAKIYSTISQIYYNGKKVAISAAHSLREDRISSSPSVSKKLDDRYELLQVDKLEEIVEDMDEIVVENIFDGVDEIAVENILDVLPQLDSCENTPVGVKNSNSNNIIELEDTKSDTSLEIRTHKLFAKYQINSRKKLQKNPLIYRHKLIAVLRDVDIAFLIPLVRIPLPYNYICGIGYIKVEKKFSPKENEEVLKHGAHSGITSGVIKKVNKDYFTVEGLESIPFCSFGDSGALVVNMNNVLYGVVVSRLENTDMIRVIRWNRISGFVSQLKLP